MDYPAQFKFDEEEQYYLITFRDVPEAITQGFSLEEAYFMAEDALVTAMDFYFDDHRPVPTPSEFTETDHRISLPVSTTAKVLLLNTMIQQGVNRSELARRLKKTKQEVSRMLSSGGQKAKIDFVAEALAVLGKKSIFTIIDKD